MKISMTVKLLAVAAIAGCRSVPMSDRTQLMLSAESSERAMGSAGYAEYT